MLYWERGGGGGVANCGGRRKKGKESLSLSHLRDLLYSCRERENQKQQSFPFLCST